MCCVPEFADFLQIRFFWLNSEMIPLIFSDIFVVCCLEE